MAQVGYDPVLPDAEVIIREEDRNGQCGRGVKVRRRRLEPGDGPQEIANKDEEACRADQGKVPFPLGSYHLLQEIPEALDDHLHEVLHRSRHRLEPPCGEKRDADQDRHHKPRHRHMLPYPWARNAERPEEIRNLEDGRVMLHYAPQFLPGKAHAGPRISLPPTLQILHEVCKACRNPEDKEDDREPRRGLEPPIKAYADRGPNGNRGSEGDSHRTQPGELTP